MRVSATAKYLRRSTRKTRLVTQAIVGRPVEEAAAILRFMPQAAARDVAKVLKSATANAENNHDLAADDFARRASFNEHVGTDDFQQAVRRVVVENQHVIDAFECSEHPRAVVFRDHGAIGAFQAVHAEVAVDCDDEHVTYFGRFLQQCDMTDMEQVEATVGEDDRATRLAQPSPQRSHVFQRDQL